MYQLFLKLRVLHEIDTLSATERIATRVSLFVHVITIIRIAYINIIIIHIVLFSISPADFKQQYWRSKLIACAGPGWGLRLERQFIVEW